MSAVYAGILFAAGSVVVAAIAAVSDSLMLGNVALVGVPTGIVVFLVGWMIEAYNNKA